MATANTYLQVTELDFAEIRNNLKTFLRGQSQLEDYDYEGSTMSVLLDVLAYNTHYNAYYLNMLANEMFLDTAQQRESVVSRAKEIGYTPQSAIGASANVQITFNNVESGIAQLTIPKNSKFTTTIDDVKYTYVTPEAYTVYNNENVFSRPITIKEGEPIQHQYTVDTTVKQRFIIPNVDVDASSITVRIKESATDSLTTEYTRATNINVVGPDSEVYFLEEYSDQQYEVLFGSGSLGKSLKGGNIVIIDYLICNGEETNGATQFSIDSLNVQTNYQSATVTTNVAAQGGRPIETIESVKFNAPRLFQTQNRAIIDSDYERILLNENADLQSAVAFGGELATPPIYGKVYIAVKRFGEEFTTASRKTELLESIQERTPLAIDPVIIDPTYTYVIPDIKTYYDRSRSTASQSQIEKAVREAIDEYATTNLERFGNKMRFSRFVRSLDNIPELGIINNDCIMTIRKKITPNTNAAEKVEIRFNNPIRKGSVDSSQFTYKGYACYLRDDEEGNIDIYRYTSSTATTNVVTNAGTVDYETGAIDIVNFSVTDYVGIQMFVDAIPTRSDVIPVREQILLMDAADATITVVPEYN